MYIYTSYWNVLKNMRKPYITWMASDQLNTKSIGWVNFYLPHCQLLSVHVLNSTDQSVSIVSLEF